MPVNKSSATCHSFAHTYHPKASVHAANNQDRMQNSTAACSKQKRQTRKKCFMSNQKNQPNSNLDSQFFEFCTLKRKECMQNACNKTRSNGDDKRSQKFRNLKQFL